jgi:hypothetical protein
VIGADGLVVGTLTELFISTSDWRIESIGIELRKDVADRIGAPRTFLHRATIELPVALIQSVSDAVVLTVDIEHLREAERPTAIEEAPQPAT